MARLRLKAPGSTPAGGAIDSLNARQRPRPPTTASVSSGAPATLPGEPGAHDEGAPPVPPAPVVDPPPAPPPPLVEELEHARSSAQHTASSNGRHREPSRDRRSRGRFLGMAHLS